MNYINKCQICNQIEEVNVEDTETESSDQNSDENLTSEKAKKPSSTASNECGTCDDCNFLLEQSFACLFGYKSKNARKNYLESHAVTKLAYTLDNCVHLYNYFKPYDMPEYDDMAKYSIPQEVI